jgi:Mg2+ and Co2+ transporter CorA
MKWRRCIRRASVISNNLNVMMKNLNAIVIAVAVPSFFAAIGGMSEFSGMIHFSNWKLGYPIFILAMAAIGITTFFAVRKFERFWKD